MIEIKKSGSNLNLNKYTVLIQDTELNAGPGATSYFFGAQPILFITIQNNAGVDFTTLYALDQAGRVLTHNCPLHNTTYSIAFSSNGTGQPLQLAELSNLGVITFDWAFPGLAVGTLTINIYTFAI